ncbi:MULTISPECIES: hypothetical protein [Xanthomonas]|uniref:SLOG domain-containing protein n=1 Tax=Xanthomonas TaxID=338 RepID=UPI000A6A1230|nr:MULTISPECIES: hypothetical protein [Xanthomonas]
MRIFLSASVPKVGRGNFYEDSDPFLIQVAVRELVTSIIRYHTLIWGGHPSVTPMIWSVCQDLGVNYSESVRLYQSIFFEDDFPKENEKFDNVIYVDRVGDDMTASLAEMRTRMLTDQSFGAGVFIGGMDGIEQEYSLFREHNADAKRIILTAPGGAAQQLGSYLTKDDAIISNTVDFAKLFDEIFPPPSPSPRRTFGMR